MQDKIIRSFTLILSALSVAPALAQNSVTLYGFIDSGLTYQKSATRPGSTSAGASSIKVASGSWFGSRFGIKGTDNLGGGTQITYLLENGFSSDSGEQLFGSLLGRQAYIGLTNNQFGSFTIGRQYSSYYLLLVPYSPTTWLTGSVGAHPGDIDGLDFTYRINNALQYTSPNMHGFVASGTYALGGVPGAVDRGSTWSGALQYINGPVGVAVGILRVKNSTRDGGTWGRDSTAYSGGEPGISAINSGYQTAAVQQRVAITGGYELTSTFGVSASYANVQSIPGSQSAFDSKAIFNVAGAVFHWMPAPAWQLAAGYSYTRATAANGIRNPARYQQVTFAESYKLSKRTSVYALQGYTHASGKTISQLGGSNIIDATATVGDGYNATSFSTKNQFVAAAGIAIRF